MKAILDVPACAAWFNRAEAAGDAGVEAELVFGAG